MIINIRKIRTISTPTPRQLATDDGTQTFFVHSQKQQRTDDDDDDDEDLDAEAEDLDEDLDAEAEDPLSQSHKTKQTQISVTKERKEDNRYLIDLRRTSVMIPSLLECPSRLLSTPQRFLHAAHNDFQL